MLYMLYNICYKEDFYFMAPLIMDNNAAINNTVNI